MLVRSPLPVKTINRLASAVFDTIAPHIYPVDDVTDTDCSVLGTTEIAAITVVFSRLSDVGFYQTGPKLK